MLACGDLVPFVLAACGDPVAGTAAVDDALAVLDAHRETLVRIEDVEVLPLLDALVGFALLRLGRGAEARARLRPAVPDSSSTGARSFPAWVRAQVLAEPAGTTGHGDAVDAHREYGLLVSHARWAARRAVLAAARATIATERLQRRARRAGPRRAAGPVDRAVQPAGLRRLAPGGPGAPRGRPRCC